MHPASTSAFPASFFGPVWDPILGITYGTILVWSWMKWTRDPSRFSSPRWRGWTGFAALALATMSSVAFVAMQLYARSIGGFNGISHSLVVFLLAFWTLSILSFALAFVSRGWTRVSALGLSVVMVFMWWVVFAIGAA